MTTSTRQSSTLAIPAVAAATLLVAAFVAAVPSDENIKKMLTQEVDCSRITDVLIASFEAGDPLAKDKVENCYLARTMMRDEALKVAEVVEVAAHLRAARAKGDIIAAEGTTGKLLWKKVKTWHLVPNLIEIVEELKQVGDEVPAQFAATKTNAYQAAAIVAFTGLNMAALQAKAKARQEKAQQEAITTKPQIDELFKKAYGGPWHPQPLATPPWLMDKEANPGKEELAQHEMSKLAEIHAAMSHMECGGKSPDQALTAGFKEELKHASKDLEAAQNCWCVVDDQGKTVGDCMEAHKPQAEVYLQCMVGRSLRRMHAQTGAVKQLASFKFLRISWFLEDVYKMACKEKNPAIETVTYNDRASSYRSLLGVKKLHDFIDTRILHRPTQ